MVRQQHPAGERLLAAAPRFRRQPVREIAEACVDVHLTVGVEARGMQTNASLEIPVDADPRCAGVPPVAMYILERVAVTSSLHESARFVCNGIVWRVGEWPEWIVANIDAGSVHVVLSAWRGVLEVVSSAVFRHPRSFDERADGGVAMVLTESLPPVLVRIEPEQPARRSLVREAFAFLKI